MKKYILTPVTQKNHTFYSMVADPREIVTAVKRAEAEEAQENQRPWSKKKVLEIVEYVMGRSGQAKIQRQRIDSKRTHHQSYR